MQSTKRWARRSFLRRGLASWGTLGSAFAFPQPNAPKPPDPPPPPTAKAYPGILRHTLIFHDLYGYSSWPSILKCQDGELLIAFCQLMRRKAKLTHADPTLTGLILRSSDQGETWSEQPEVIGDYKYRGMDDPGITQLSSGRILVNAFRRSFAPRAAAENRTGVKYVPVEPYQWATGYSDKRTYVFHSTDNARTWLDPVHVDISPYRCGCQLRPVVELTDGTLLLPCYEEFYRAPTRQAKSASWDGVERTWTAFCCRSRDDGNTWGDATAIAAHKDLGFNEPSLIQLPSGKVLALLRTSTGKWLYQCESVDSGYTWTEPRKTRLFGRPADLQLLSNGKLLATYGRRRAPFGIRACTSIDEGKTWDIDNEIVLRDDFKNGDLGYPTTTELDDGTLLTAYYGRDENNDVTCLQGTFWKLSS